MPRVYGKGPFELGNFHRVENFFGSGIRLDGEDVAFSSSVAVHPTDCSTSLGETACSYQTALCSCSRRAARALIDRTTICRKLLFPGMNIDRYPSAVRGAPRRLSCHSSGISLHPVFRRGNARSGSA